MVKLSVFVGNFIALLLLLAPQTSQAHDISGSLGSLPVLAETNEKGILVDYLNAMQRAYPEGKIQFDVVPLERSLKNVVSGASDFQAPLLKDPKQNEKDLNYRYSDASIFNVTFVLYTNRANKKINLKNLQDFNVESDVAGIRFMGFPAKASSCIECSLKKVNEGRIDGYIFAGLECDQFVDKDHLSNIKSAVFHKYDVRFTLPLGKKGDETNEILTKIVNRTKKNGDFHKILGVINDYYKNWKPRK